jgi:hypothetical protein
MRRYRVSLALVVLVLVALGLGFAGLARVDAQSGGGYDLTWSSIDGGGLMFSTGGGYSLGGTIGQADAGVLTGGGYALNGGFWAPGWRFPAYLPLVLR